MGSGFGYVPDKRRILQTADRIYFGVYIGYGGSDLGCAVIEEYPFPIPVVKDEDGEEDEFDPKRVAEWVGVTHAEAWQRMYDWADERKEKAEAGGGRVGFRGGGHRCRPRIRRTPGGPDPAPEGDADRVEVW